MTTAILFITFFILLFIGVPISFSIAISSILALLTELPINIALFTASQKIFTGLDSFTLLAIPFFILAGNIMNSGGIALRLVDFARMLGGRAPGYLAQVNVLGNMLFGAISGSGAASAVAIGGMIDPMAKEEGYEAKFIAAVNTASCPTGLLIPPSNILVIYSLAGGGLSISALFVAGYIPGIIMGLLVALVAYIYAKKMKYPVSHHKYTFGEIIKITLRAFPSLLLIIFIMGGIILGIFTPTEGGGMAVIYTIILSLFYKQLNKAKIFEICKASIETCGIVLFLVAVSGIMSWVMSFAQIPQAISTFMLALSENKYVILFLINILFLIAGTFMDMSPAVLIFTPIFLPIIKTLGVDPIHFGIIMVFNFSVGLMTPPVGNALFVGTTVAKAKVEDVVKMLIPYFIVLFFGLLLVTYIPSLSLYLPKLFGLIYE